MSVANWSVPLSPHVTFRNRQPNSHGIVALARTGEVTSRTRTLSPIWRKTESETCDRCPWSHPGTGLVEAPEKLLNIAAHESQESSSLISS